MKGRLDVDGAAALTWTLWLPLASHNKEKNIEKLIGALVPYWGIGTSCTSAVTAFLSATGTHEHDRVLGRKPGLLMSTCKCGNLRRYTWYGSRKYCVRPGRTRTYCFMPHRAARQITARRTSHIARSVYDHARPSIGVQSIIATKSTCVPNDE